MLREKKKKEGCESGYSGGGDLGTLPLRVVTCVCDVQQQQAADQWRRISSSSSSSLSLWLLNMSRLEYEFSPIDRRCKSIPHGDN